MPSRKPPSRQLVELLCKALVDSELCDELFADPKAVARAFGLGAAETQTIRRLDRQAFEQRVIQLRSA